VTVSAVALVLVPVFGSAVATVAIVLWPRIVSWVRAHLLPWVEGHMPWLADDVRIALHDADQVAVHVRHQAREAWRRLRRVLLHQTVEFVRLVDDEWSLRITTWIITKQQQHKPYAKIVTEQPLRWDELPDQVRASALLRGRDRYLLDVTDAHDRLLLSVH
jgi:hypothetical protein